MFLWLKPNAFISDCISWACVCAFYFVVSMERTGQKRALRVISKAIKRQIAFYLTQTNEINSLLEMCHLLQVCLYREIFQKLTFRWRRSRIHRRISDVSAYTAVQMHISDSYLIYFHIWMKPIVIHVTFSAYAVVGQICVTWEDKITWTMLCICGWGSIVGM